MRRRRRRAGSGMHGAAGWLFAELAMILFLVAVGSQEPAAVPDAAAPPPAPSPAEPPNPQGLKLETQKFALSTAGDNGAVLTRFRETLDRTVGANANVGLIMLFGNGSRSGQPVIQGTQLSKRVRDIVLPAGIPQLKSTIDIRCYFGSDGTPGDVTVELFLLTGPA